MKTEKQSETTKSRSDNNPNNSPETIEMFEAIYLVLSEAAPYKLEVECMAVFCEDLMDKDWDGNFNRAANHALVEWDI
jgi:hypothetical protein